MPKSIEMYLFNTEEFTVLRVAFYIRVMSRCK